MSENLLHIKLEYEENLKGKGDILYLESSLLKITRAMRNFHDIKRIETELKQELGREIKNSILSMKNLKAILPHQNFPKKFRAETKKETPELSFKKEKISEEEGDIEQQLKEINEKLRTIKG